MVAPGGVRYDRFAILALAITVAVAPHALAARQSAGEILTPAPGAKIRAGDVVKISWTHVPAGVDEFELLLSIDGGRTFPLRLTEMLDPDLTSYAWRVPNLPTGAACLRLRVGEEDEEILLRPGPLFELAGDASAATGRITFKAGEWWPTDTIAIVPREVDLEPAISEPEPREDEQLTAVAVPTQRSAADSPEPEAPLGPDDATPRRVSSASLPCSTHTPLLFLPKRE